MHTNGSHAFAPGLDAELRMAIASKWRDYGGEPTRVPVFLECPPGGTFPKHLKLVAQAGPLATAWVKPADLLPLAGSCAVHLAQPFALPRRLRPVNNAPAAKVSYRKIPQQQGGTLLAAIDDGCPFAHPSLLRSPASTRVIALWDQNQSEQQVFPGVKYGRVWSGAMLDKVITSRSTASGSIDEAACYRATGQYSLAFPRTHGSHVLGRMAGSEFWIGGRVPPGFSPGMNKMSDKAAGCDVAFVQMPREALETVSPAAVMFHAFNGLCYLADFARRHGYRRLVIALAYENFMGPHDSSSWFERAVDELVTCFNTPDEFELRVVLAAGNSGMRAAHQEIRPAMFLPEGQNPEPIHLFVAPDTEVPTWVELWLPKQWLAVDPTLSLRLRAPGGRELSDQLPVGGDNFWHIDDVPIISVYGQQGGNQPGLRQRVLLRLAPTRSAHGEPVAPHGLWTIGVVSEQPPANFEDIGLVYVVRAGANMNQSILGRQSRAALQRIKDKNRTLSGLAGGRQVIVASSSYPKDFPYKGRLDAPFGAHRQKVGPEKAAGYAGVPSEMWRRGRCNLVDAFAATEDGLALAGHIGMGTRSGAVYRLTGTSVAVPTVARWLANQATWPRLPGQLGQAATAPATGQPRVVNVPFDVWPPPPPTTNAKAKRRRSPAAVAGGG